MNKEQAFALLSNHVKNQNLIRHHLACEAAMRALARHFHNNEDSWGLAGLVHDIDWEETKDDPHRHSIRAEIILREAGLPDEIIRAVKAHNHLHNLPLETLMEKALFVAEELTGMITACALVQPDKKLASVKPESVVKKMKDKAFARGVNRETISRSQELLGIDCMGLIGLTLGAMQDISGDLGL